MRQLAETLKRNLIVFALLAAYTWVTAAAWTVATVRLAVDGGLLAIVLVSLAIDRPFTLQYARASFGTNYGRLRALKAVYDPTNLFRVNANIAP